MATNSLQLGLYTFSETAFRGIIRLSKCIIKRIAVVISIALVNLLVTKAQTPAVRFDFLNPNLSLLEYLIKSQIDSLRYVQNLLPLYNDSVCYLAARDHGEYLMDYEDIDHLQSDNPEKLGPQERVNYYGATGYVAGENIVKIFVGSPFLYGTGSNQPENYILTTYPEIARFIAKAWKNSAVHYLNILSPEYDITGVSAVFNEDDNSLICVQVFAEVDENYTFHHHPEYFPYDNKFIIPDTQQHVVLPPDTGCIFDNPWGLEIHDNLSVTDTSDANNLLVKNCHIIYKKNEVYLYLGPYQSASNLFTGEYDGLALEIVPAELYNCKSNNRYPGILEGECPVKGTLTKPLYRDKLLKKNLHNNKKKSDLNYLIPLAGTLPGIPADSFEANIIVIKDKKIWKAVQTHHLCGKMHDLNIDVPLFYGNILRVNIDSLSESGLADTATSYPSVTGLPGNMTDHASETLHKYNLLFEEYVESCRNSQSHCNETNFLNRLDSLQSELLTSFLQGRLKFEHIDSLPVLLRDDAGLLERYQPFARLLYLRLMFKHRYLPLQMNDTSLLEALSLLKRFRNSPPEVLYNYFALLIIMNKGEFTENITPANLREIEDIISRAKDYIPSRNLELLQLFYHFQNLNKNGQNETLNMNPVIKSLDYIYHYYLHNEISTPVRVNLAEIFILFRMYEYAYQILLPALNPDSFSKAAYILSLKLLYSGMIQTGNATDYYTRLIEAANMLSDDEWTGLFEGPCRINFQHLNYKPLRQLYCARKRVSG